MTLWRPMAVSVLIGVLAGFTWLTLTGRFEAIDSAVIRSIYLWRGATLTQVMTGISLLGNQALFLATVALAAFLIARKRWGDLGQYMLLMGGQELINYGLKALIARPRPDYLPLLHETGYSFPSGHSMASVVFYGALALWLRRKQYGGRYSRWGWLIAAALFALAVGLSRIYLGVHYPSDVLAGFLAGAVWLLIAFPRKPT